MRLRVTLLAAGLFAVTLGGAAFVLLHALEGDLVDDVRSDDLAALRAQAAELTADGVPTDAISVPASGGQAYELPVAGTTRRIVVFLRDGSGMVTRDLPAPPAGEAGAGVGSEPHTDVVYAGGIPVANQSVLGITGDVRDYNVSSISAGDYTLATASPLDSVRQTIATTRRLLWIVGPALVALVAGLAWLLAGRALRPVHAVTSRVAAIGSRSLHERVPVPSSRDEIAELASTMNGMLARLETASTTNRRLVSDASHELRTPIAVMRAELDVARRSERPDWVVTGEVFDGELERLQGLVDDLLLLARGDEQALARNPFSIADTVRDIGRGPGACPSTSRSAPTSIQSSGTRRPSAGPSTTSSATPPATRPARCASPWPAMPRWSASTSTTTGPASRRRGGPTSSSASCASTKAALATAAAPASASPSRPTWPPPTAAASTSARRRSAAPASRSCCRGDHRADETRRLRSRRRACSPARRGGRSLQAIRHGLAVVALAGAAAVLVPTPVAAQTTPVVVDDLRRRRAGERRATHRCRDADRRRTDRRRRRAATGTAAAAIVVPPGTDAGGLSIAPAGATAFVTHVGVSNSFVSPIDVATNTFVSDIAIGDQSAGPIATAVSPDGSTLYVVNESANTVVPVAIASGLRGRRSRCRRARSTSPSRPTARPRSSSRARRRRNSSRSRWRRAP